MTSLNIDEIAPSNEPLTDAKNSNKQNIIYKKQYIISRKVGEDEMREIKENFEEPDKYLSLNSKIVVGLLPFKTEGTSSNNIPMRPITSIPKQKHKRQLTAKSFKSHRPYFSDNIINTSQQNPIPNLKQGLHYHLESKDGLDEIKKEAKAKEEEFKRTGTNMLISNQANAQTKVDYIYQEKLLKKQNSNRILSTKTSKKIGKVNCRKESELLYNRIEEYRLRKQMIDILDNQKPIQEKFGNNYWMYTLRRPKKPECARFNYVNIGAKGKEIWSQFIDYPYRPFETIQDPQSMIKNKYSKIASNSYYQDNLKKIKCNLPKMEDINDLKVEGKNLIDEEFKFVDDYYKKSNKDAKLRVYKDPFEQKEKCVMEMTIKKNYDKANKEICKCRNISSKTRKINI